MPRRPKKKCCLSTPRCARCPLRMLAEGTLPEGYAVQRRRLVKVAAGPDVEAGKGKGTKHKGTKHKGKSKSTRRKG